MPAWGESDVNMLIQYTEQLNDWVVGAFASVYFTKARLDSSAEKVLCGFSFFFLVVLLRAILEMYMQDISFAGLTRLENGMVSGITQLVIGSLLVHQQHRVICLIS